MYLPQKDQQLRLSVSPSGSKLDPSKLVFNRPLSFRPRNLEFLCSKVAVVVIFLSGIKP